LFAWKTLRGRRDKGFREVRVEKYFLGGKGGSEAGKLTGK
jgi:hypothetical protein